MSGQVSTAPTSHCGDRHPAGSEHTDQESWPASGSQCPHLLVTSRRPPKHILTWIKKIKGKEEKKGGRKEGKQMKRKKKKRNEGSLEGRRKEGERVGGREGRKEKMNFLFEQEGRLPGTDRGK